ncbi:MAG TPA: hypothetical protein VK177_16455 [Flavobacteriales bacterium]|nr:hypothetical protein [Flavobacteriales bacterium]
MGSCFHNPWRGLANGIHNNNLESFNSKLKRKLFQLLDLSAHEKVPQQMEKFRNTYNNIPQALLKTLSPNEVLNGLIPGENVWPELENAIDEARNTRLLTNMISCCR